MNVALIAHDHKKDILINFVLAYSEIFKKHNLFATGTTRKKKKKMTGLSVHKFLAGRVGGDQQVGAKIAENNMDLIIFLRDPLTAQPHEPDVQALLRLCDVHAIPLATNLASAELFINGLKRGDLNYREID